MYFVLNLLDIVNLYTIMGKNYVLCLPICFFLAIVTINVQFVFK